MISRKKSRQILLQCVYSDLYITPTPFEGFDTYSDEIDFSLLDEKYFHTLRWIIHENYNFFWEIIQQLAPKFDRETLPKIHIAILMIALAEIFFWKEDNIDMKISINEAINLAKVFSDEIGAKFISGTLGTFARNREKFSI